MAQKSSKIPGSAYSGIRLNKKDPQVGIVTHENSKRYDIDGKVDYVEWFRDYAKKENAKVVASAIAGDGELKKLGSKLWLQNDIVPLILKTNYKQNTIDLARFALSHFVDDIAQIILEEDNEVQVGDLVMLSDYEKITPKQDFELLKKFAKKFHGKKIVYFSATPRGGGVALMRHALMRLYKLLDINASWHILEESLEVFEITKKKFHNVLHGIAPPHVVLTEKDKVIYNKWIANNANKLRPLFKGADVIVIDDPQPSGLVPYIKEESPDTKIIYRSHIQLESDLISDPHSRQHKTWSFIWENIKDVDLFISHPIEEFIPSGVDKKDVVLMPATIDPLDGLNKPLTDWQKNYYLDLFDKHLIETGQTKLDRTRPIIAQVARFDPSKGIPDVLESYWRLRKMLEIKKSSLAPQLVITGQGSIDDPEGFPILKQTLSVVHSDKYIDYADDIKIARTPAIDQIQNVIMRQATIYLQLSHKEGFEDKISAALLMGTPAIIYNSGGMPLQVEHRKSGFIVEVGDSISVAEYMFELLTDKNLLKQMEANAVRYAIPDITVISNAINWLYLADKLTVKGEVYGNLQSVYDMVRNEEKSTGSSKKRPGDGRFDR